MNKTKVYYTHLGKKYYYEFEKYLPEKFGTSYLHQVADKNIPSDLYNLLIDKNSDYKLCRDDGPAFEYYNPWMLKYWQSSKCEHRSNIFDWTKNTNHILCNFCHEFCKQKCFIKFN